MYPELKNLNGWKENKSRGHTEISDDKYLGGWKYKSPSDEHSNILIFVFFKRGKYVMYCGEPTYYLSGTPLSRG